MWQRPNGPWSIPSSRIFLRRIFTIAKAKSTAIIAIKGFHSSQLFTWATNVLSTIRGRVRLLLSVNNNKKESIHIKGVGEITPSKIWQIGLKAYLGFFYRYCHYHCQALAINRPWTWPLCPKQIGSAATIEIRSNTVFFYKNEGKKIKELLNLKA